MMRSIVLVLGCLVSLAPLKAHAGVQTTTVAGTVYRADGSGAAGTLILSWPAFSTAQGDAVAAGTVTIQIGANDALSVTLAPNEGATPAGTYYTAVYHLSDGTVNKEYWLVPQVPNATLAAVRAKVVPAAVAVALNGVGSVSAVYQLMSTNFLPLGGGTLNGPLTLSGQPTAAGQAVSKSYVDTALGGISAASLGALPLTGGTVSGDIIAKDGSPVASEAYVAQHAGSGSVAASGTLGSVQINNGQGSLGTDTGLTMDTTNHVLNISSQVTMIAEQNVPRAVYDPMDPKYAGGLGNANTPAEQQAALQAALDQAACDIHDGKIDAATVVYPVSIRGNFSELLVHGGITLECSAQSQFGSCVVTQSAYPSGTPDANTGHVLMRLDFTNHGMCHGVDTVFGGDSAVVRGFSMHGQGSAAGGGDEGVRVYAIHDRVEHNSFDNFGGPAVEMNGTPGDGYAGWNYIQNAPKYFIDNDTAPMPNGPVGAMECVGEDTMCEWNEVSTGSAFNHNFHRLANYPNVPAYLVGGGSLRFPNNFAQLSDVGLMQLCCSVGNQVVNFRSDFMSGSAIFAPSGGGAYTGVNVSGGCSDPTWVDPVSHVSGCHVIDDTGGGNAYSDVTAFAQAGFSSTSYVGAVIGAVSDGVKTSNISSSFPQDQYGNGKMYDRGAADYYGNAGPSGAVVTNASCQMTGATALTINECSHLVLTDTSATSVQFILGGINGQILTVDGTTLDTLVAGIGSNYGQPAIRTCSGANVQLGQGAQAFYYTNADHAWHQICGGATSEVQTASGTTDPTFNADSSSGNAMTLTGSAGAGTVLTLTHNNHSWFWYCTDGFGCGVYDAASSLQLMQMETAGTTPYISTGMVALSAGAPASSTPAGGCVANSVWADDSYLYHCSSDGTTIKRAALGSF